MLIWYLRLTVGGIALLALVAEVCGFLRFAPTIGLPWWAAVVCVIPIIAIEWGFLIFARRLWARGWLGKLLSPFPVLAWFVAIAVSSVAVQSVIYSMLASADRSAAQKSEWRTNLKATLAGLDAQITSLSKTNVPRPLKTVHEALEWVALAPSLRRATDDCQRIVQDEHRKPCKEVLSLRKELAASRDYDDLQRRAEALRAQLATIPIEAEQDQMPRSCELLYGGVVKMGGKEGIALLVMLLLIWVPALGPFCLDIVNREDGDALANAAAHGQAPTAGWPARAQGLSATQPLEGASARGQTQVYPPAPTVRAEKPSQQKLAQPPHQGLSIEQVEACPPTDSGLPELPEPVEARSARPLHRAPAQQQSACPSAPYPLPPTRRTGATVGQAGAGARIEACPPTEGGLPELSEPVDRLARPLHGAPAQQQSACPLPPTRRTGATVGQAGAGAWTALRNGTKTGRPGVSRAHDAVQAFAATLDWGAGVCATGSELYLGYMTARVVYGWPYLAPNIFGKEIKRIVEARGGRKRKSSSQFYDGVSVSPTKGRTPLVVQARPVDCPLSCAGMRTAKL